MSIQQVGNLVSLQPQVAGTRNGPIMQWLCPLMGLVPHYVVASMGTGHKVLGGLGQRFPNKKRCIHKKRGWG
jgi:hypothetical protein